MSGSFFLSAVEVAGHDCGRSLDKAQAWDVVPALLQANATEAPKICKGADGNDCIKYKLEAEVEQIWQLKEEAQLSRRAAAADARRRAHLGSENGIFVLHQRRKHRAAPRLWAKVHSTPPVEITGTRLVPKSIAGRAGRNRFAALARNNSPEAAFDVDGAGGVGLRKACCEVDLGADCTISEVSTQGRHPPTRIYPQIKYERRALRRDQRGAEYTEYCVEGNPDWSLAHDGRYMGPFWPVLDLKSAAEAGAHARNPARWPTWKEELQWVTRYQLLARADGGRAWISVGHFDGNTDATTEIVRSLSAFKGGLIARYLRFVPLGAVGGGALRVGVYGARLPGAPQPAGTTLAPRLAPFGAGGMALCGADVARAAATYCQPADDDGPVPIEYELERCRPGAVNAQYAADGQSDLQIAPHNRSPYGRRAGRPTLRRQLWLDAGGAGVKPWQIDGEAKQAAKSLAQTLQQS